MDETTNTEPVISMEPVKDKDLVQKINYAWDVVLALLSGFWRIIDESSFFRRAALVMSGYLTYISLKWSMDFAIASPKAETATLIAAVMLPISGLQGWALNFYTSSRVITPPTKT